MSIPTLGAVCWQQRSVWAELRCSFWNALGANAARAAVDGALVANLDVAIAWVIAFALTVLLELPVVAFGTRDLSIALGRRIAVALLGQALTHPLVWFAFPLAFPTRPELGFWLSELFAFVAEAALYALLLRGTTWTRAAGVSATANGLSLGFGVLLDAISV